LVAGVFRPKILSKKPPPLDLESAAKAVIASRRRISDFNIYGML
jgi:hypothetical protein